MPNPGVRVYYLEMLARPELRLVPPRDGLTIIHAKHPTVAYYRFLYATVGQDYNWQSRRRLSDEALTALIHDPLNEVHVLHVNGTPAGFAELDRRTLNEIELTQFGLMPEYIGQGLGRYFLSWTIDKAWSYQPKRFWLHTCNEDHASALPNYLKRGFRLYKEKVGGGE